MSEIQYISNSFQGLSHAENQDGLIILENEDFSLFGIFDGVSMSENPGNGVATAIKFIREEYGNFLDKNRSDLNKMMYAANQSILKSGIHGSFTTYAVAVFHKKALCYSSMGDSRIYAIGKKKTLQLTTDDTLYTGSNMLTRCLGADNLLPDDFVVKDYQPDNELLLLSTDGFYHAVHPEKEMFGMKIREMDMESAASFLEASVKGRNFDDATYILVRIRTESKKKSEKKSRKAVNKG